MELLIEAKKGNKKAFQELVEPIQIKLYKTARVYFSIEEEATKAVKDSLKTLFKEIINVNTEEDLLYLGLKFLIESSEKKMRKKANKKWFAKTHNEKYKTEYQFYCKDSILEGYITSLRKEIRLIAILYFYDGLTIKKIANILKISDKEVVNIVDESRIKLYEMISNEGVKKYNEYV